MIQLSSNLFSKEKKTYISEVDFYWECQPSVQSPQGSTTWTKEGNREDGRLGLDRLENRPLRRTTEVIIPDEIS